MAKLKEIAKLIRSKNAGPFHLTFDILFDDPGKYLRVKESGAVSKEMISNNIYMVSPWKTFSSSFVTTPLRLKPLFPALSPRVIFSTATCTGASSMRPWWILKSLSIPNPFESDRAFPFLNFP